MKKSWNKKLLLLAIVSASIMLAPIPPDVIAQEADANSVATARYSLTDTIEAEAKSVLNELTPDGTKIGAVVRLYNDSTRVTRIPEYEVRVKTQDGVEYTLKPSAVNAKAIQPKETAELSYMLLVDRSDDFSLSELSWVDVDEYVYPKQETPILTIPIAPLEWKGGRGEIKNAAAIKNWGETFTIPTESPSLAYKPIGLSEQSTPQGRVVLVRMAVENKGDSSKKVPDFRIDGVADNKTYSGNRVEQAPLILGAGEKGIVDFTIPAESIAVLKSLNVLNVESFAQDNQTMSTYGIGRINIKLQNYVDSGSFNDGLEVYSSNNTIPFDPSNRLIAPGLDVTLSALHIHTSENGAFQTAVAKFKLLNRNDRATPVPSFQAVLRDAEGYEFAGTRQKTEMQELVPNVGYVLVYSFVLPASEKGDRLMMTLTDDQTLAPYSLPIASFRTKIQTDNESATLNLYPYRVTINSWSAEAASAPGGASQGNLPYTYKLTMDLDVGMEEKAVTEMNFSRLKVELVDVAGHALGAQELSFTGDNRLTSGTRTLTFGSNRFEPTVGIRLYETIDTPLGEADRLISTLQK